MGAVPQEGVGLLGVGIGVQIIVSLHVWESNLGPPEEQLLPLTAEPSLQNPGLEFVIHLPEPPRCRGGQNSLRWQTLYWNHLSDVCFPSI